MISYLRLWFRNPVFLLALAAGLIAFVVQSGEVGSADTMHRLQSTHAFWTSQPPVFPNEFPEFGVHGRGGSLQSWYGIGQSLLMLPQDILGTYISDLAVFDNYGDTDPTVRDIVVTYFTNILISRAHRACLLPAAASIRFQRLPFRRRCSRPASRHHSPALHAEHDGEQLHLSPHADRLFIPI